MSFSKSGITGDSYGSIDVVALRTASNNREFPAAVAGVITLPGGAWEITNAVDLLGDRIVCTGVVTIFGTSSETASLRSTGLGAGLAMISSAYSLPMYNITLTSPAGAYALSLVTTDATQALDFSAVNFVDCANIGTVSGFNNFIINSSAFINSSGLIFDGTIGTISFNGCSVASSTGTVITLPATLTVTRRFRITYSSIRITGGTGINASVSAVIPNDAYILDTVVFTGGGTYLAGVLYSDNKSNFSRCTGIENSKTVGFATVTNNATATTIAVNVPIKAAGTYALQSISQRFSLSSNKLTCNSSFIQSYKITAISTLSSNNNNVVGVYIAKNNTVIANSLNYTTTNGSGKSENIACFTVESLTSTDVIDVWVVNTTGNNDITMSYLSIFIDAVS